MERRVSEVTVERTVTAVKLTDDEMKGVELLVRKGVFRRCSAKQGRYFYWIYPGIDYFVEF